MPLGRNRRPLHVSLQSGQIQNCCHPNDDAEELTDYASPGQKAFGQKLIDKEVFNVPNEKRAVVLENLKLIREDNRRDFRF